MGIKKVGILIIFLVLLCGCQLFSTYNNSLDKEQVKVTEYAVPDLDYFSPIFFKGETMLAQQGQDVPKHYMSLYTSNHFKNFKQIALFKNCFGQFYMNQNNSEEVFFVSSEGKKCIFRSSDQGNSWQKIYEDDADYLSLEYLAFHPSNHEIFLVKNYREQGIKILKSKDSGMHWNKLWETKEILMVYQFIIDPKNTKHFLIAAAKGLWESLDSGYSWSKIVPEESLMVLFDPNENDKAYFVTKYSAREKCIYKLYKGKISKISLPQIKSLEGVGIACQPNTNRIFLVAIQYNEKESDYTTTIFQLHNDSFTSITQVQSKDRVLEKIFFDSTNSDVIYVYTYKNIYKIDLQSAL